MIKTNKELTILDLRKQTQKVEIYMYGTGEYIWKKRYTTQKNFFLAEVHIGKIACYEFEVSDETQLMALER